MIEITLNRILKEGVGANQSTSFDQALQMYQKKISNGEIGFTKLPFDSSPLSKVKSLGSRWKKNFSHLLVLGMGGSSLGAQTLARALAPHSSKKIIFLDNIDPDEMIPLTQNIPWKRTGIFFVSKSGSTLETWAQWFFLEKQIHKSLGKRWKDHVVTCTDPVKGELRRWTKTHEVLSFEIPSNIGGRFSVLTPVGLFPASFLGLKPEKLLKGAGAWGEPTQWSPKNLPPFHDLLKALLNSHSGGRPIHVLMPYCHQLDVFTKWFVQIWAESLGKIGSHGPIGSTPLAALGVTDQHSQMQNFMQGPQDKVLGFIWNKSVKFPGSISKSKDIPEKLKFISGTSLRKILESEFQATRSALEEAHRPTYTIEIDQLNEESLGALFYLYAHMTVLFGLNLGINPMDQPGVERAKELARGFFN